MEMNSSGVSLHFEKHKANNSSVNGLQRHNERKPGQNHSNEKIDDTRTADNVLLVKSNDTYQNRVAEIIQQNRKGGLKGVRKDAVRMVEATVQLSGMILDQNEEQQEAVLTSAFEWLKETFGEENIVSASIHKDETNMHLHFDFVPIRDSKLTAKSIISKPSLKIYQSDSLKHLQKEFPLMNFQRQELSDYNGLSQKAFEAFQEHKAEAYKEIDQREMALNARESSFNAYYDDIKAILEETRQREANAIEREKNAIERENNAKMLEGAVTILQDMVEEVWKKIDMLAKLIMSGRVRQQEAEQVVTEAMERRKPFDWRNRNHLKGLADDISELTEQIDLDDELEL